MNYRCSSFLIIFLINLVYTEDGINKSHSLAKRQLFPRASRTVPLSRSRQYPAPEELETHDQNDEISRGDNEYEYEPQDPSPVRRFRGRQQPPEDDDYHYTEVPPTTTPAPRATEPSKTPIRAFNSRPSRPRFGAQPKVTTGSTTSSRATVAPNSRFRSQLSPVPAQRIDVATEVLNKPPPSRSSSRSFGSSRTNNDHELPRQPVLDGGNVPATRRIGTGRVRGRGRARAKSSTTTTTTTTTTAAPEEEYYYYYYDDEEPDQKQQAATTARSTTTTTTTTTQKPPSLPRKPSLSRGRFSSSGSRTTNKPRSPVKFDIESQFLPPPEDAPLEIETTSRATKKYTTTSTEATAPDGIPYHLKGKYKPRTDGRFIDYLRDPNRPRELKGFDLTEYPFYVKVPDDIVFDCEDKKDGYYASVPHHCQLFHYCFAGSRYDFLCANYTLYDQTTFTCRFANNVDCPSSEKYYYRNDDLWKETTTTTTTEAPKKRKITPKDDEYEEEYEYDDEEYYDEEEDDNKRRRRPYRRRRNRRRKSKGKSSSTISTQDAN